MQERGHPNEYPIEQAKNEPVSRRSETREEREADIAWFEEFCKENIEPGSLSSLYLEEREALRKIYPGTLVDLGRQGIVQVRVLGEDGWYDVEPDQKGDS